MARLYEPSIESILAKNVYTVVTLAERNVLALMNIRRGAWKIVGSPACMQSVVYVVRSPVLLVRNHADGRHSFFPIDYISHLFAGTATTTPVLYHVVRSVKAVFQAPFCH